MRNSTVLYTCNNTGFHNVTLANQYGVVVYDVSTRPPPSPTLAAEPAPRPLATLARRPPFSRAHPRHHALVSPQWSNAKAIWANAHPMSSEELITQQAEMVYAADPGVPGYMPRVWAYRNTIKVRRRERRRDGRRGSTLSSPPPPPPPPLPL